MKFKFSLDSVLKVRKHQEKLHKQKLAEEMMKKKEIDDLQTSIRDRLKTYLKDAQVKEVENIHTIKRYGKHMDQSHQLITKLGEESDEAEKSVSKVREKLNVAYKKRHILEKVKEFEQNLFTQKKEKQDQKSMDEIATQFYSR